MKRPTLHHINNALSLVAIALCLYLLILPFWPQATYQWQKTPPLAQPSPPPETIPEQNTLVIPSMKLQQPIHEGDKAALNKGVWHTPLSSAPDKGGNVVLTGHRFTYGGPAVFYHLDKVKQGDEIVLYWHKQKYRYQVEQVLVVPPSAAEVIAPTGQPRLTIYTCTPLVTAKNRLVIQAKPLEATP